MSEAGRRSATGKSALLVPAYVMVAFSAIFGTAHCGGSNGGSTQQSGSGGGSGAAGSSAGNGGRSELAGFSGVASTAGGAGFAGSGAVGGGSDVSSCGNFSSGDATCDQCIQEESPCCNSARACATADDGGVDNAGKTRCQQLLDCIYNCASGLSGSGGTPPSYTQCQVTCATAYNDTEYDSAIGIVACVQALCSQQCGALK